MNLSTRHVQSTKASKATIDRWNLVESSWVGNKTSEGSTKKIERMFKKKNSHQATLYHWSSWSSQPWPVGFQHVKQRFSAWTNVETPSHHEATICMQGIKGTNLHTKQRGSTSIFCLIFWTSFPTFVSDANLASKIMTSTCWPMSRARSWWKSLTRFRNLTGKLGWWIGSNGEMKMLGVKVLTESCMLTTMPDVVCVSATLIYILYILYQILPLLAE